MFFRSFTLRVPSFYVDDQFLHHHVISYDKWWVASMGEKGGNGWGWEGWERVWMRRKGRVHRSAPGRRGRIYFVLEYRVDCYVQCRAYTLGSKHTAVGKSVYTRLRQHPKPHGSARVSKKYHRAAGRLIFIIAISRDLIGSISWFYGWYYMRNVNAQSG